METSGQLMMNIWDQWDANARVHQDGSIHASIPREKVVAFRDWLNERNYELTGQSAAPGGKRLFCKAQQR